MPLTLLAFSWPEEARLTTSSVAPEWLRMRILKNTSLTGAVGCTINRTQEAKKEIPDTPGGTPPGREEDTVLRIAVAAFLLSAFVLPAFSGTHKDAYPNACSELWAAVKDTLGNPENYTVKLTDEAKMTSSYAVKHSAHVTITGALRQRPNTVSLSSKGTGCEMQVESNYSGFEHNDAGDFTKRVNESLAKGKGSTPSAPAKPADAK